MLASIMLRITMGLRVKDAVLTFAKVRPPGIYKEDYVASLFSYYHERRCAPAPQPAMHSTCPELTPYTDDVPPCEQCARVFCFRLPVMMQGGIERRCASGGILHLKHLHRRL